MALLAASTAFVTSPGDAQAQATDGEFTVQRFNPAPGPRNYFTTRGVRTEGNMSWSAGLFVNYAWEPFVVLSCQNAVSCGDPGAVETDLPVVENMVTGDVLGSFTPIPRLQLGLKIPVTWVDGQGIDDRGRPVEGGTSAVGMGDMELEGKFRLHGELKDPFVVGAGAFVTAPLGHATSEGNYIGDQTPSVGARAIMDGAQGPFSFGANLVGVWRGKGEIGGSTIGPEFRYGVGVGYAVGPMIRIVLDGFGATNFSTDPGENALEADLGAQITPHGMPITISVGAGTGLVEGVGVPKLRAFLGFMYVAEGVDADQDTILDDADKCPTDKEDADGFEDTDGCPDPDNDNDGVLDADDECIEEPETKNGVTDEDGCPDEAAAPAAPAPVPGAKPAPKKP